MLLALAYLSLKLLVFGIQFPLHALREVTLLKRLQHENVIGLRDIIIATGAAAS